VTQPSGPDVAALVSVALTAARNAPGALVIPTVLLERALLQERKPQRGAGLANAAAGWFERAGFHAERSHVGGHGYGAIIKEITDWYAQDIDVVFTEREAKLAIQADLLAARAGMSKENLALLREQSDQQFQRSLDLMRSMTADECDACYNLIFLEYQDEDGPILDDFRERAGSPDLLVWSKSESAKQWFFCEVKSLNDHLGPAQVAWIKESSDQIDGRFLLLLLDS
jgi:VRR-NUC domain